VLALCDSGDNKKATNSSFQLYCATNAKGVAKLPSNVSYAQGSVLPLAISTAASALFQKDAHVLPHPQPNAKPTGKIVLVWGGGSSVGSCAIQLVKSVGFEVATTASSRNHDYCTSLGAKYVFDHTKASVVDDIVMALKGKNFGGVQRHHWGRGNGEVRADCKPA
jgi:NADPH:quinone reductase-like Zn-dependent oxidoreductase